MTQLSSIAVVGMACRFPQAPNIDLYWQNLKRGVNAVSEIPPSRWSWQEIIGNPEKDAGKTNSKWGGFIEGVDLFDPLFFRLSPQQAAYIDPQQRLALQAAWHTIENAGYSAAALSGRRIGVYVGVSKNDYAELMRTYNVPISSYVSTGTVHSIIANRISYFLNLRGKSEVIDTACSSSLVALHNAIRDIRNGDCEAALVGGVNALLSPTMYISHGQSGMLSTEGRCAAFDHRADGYVRSEGVGFIFIKPLESALNHRDHISAVIRGSAVNHGGRANSLTSPNITAQAEVIQSAHQDAGVKPSSISYIEAHGTGTSLGDPIEIDALKKVFGSCKTKCGIASVKTNVGHLESASGMAGLIKIFLSLQNQWLPPQLHFEKLNPHISFDNSPFYLVTHGHSWEYSGLRRAGISAFGMGGVNAHIVVEQAPDKPINPETNQTHIIPLSAKNHDALKRQAHQLQKYLQSNKVRLCDVAHTLQHGRENMNNRLVFLADNESDLLKQLKNFTQEPIGKNLLGQAKEQREVLLANQKNLELIAQQWVDGTKVDWGNIAGGERIPLPVYPFEKRRCWFDIPIHKQVNQHESANQVNLPELSKTTFNITSSNYFANDHIVDGKEILPAVAYFGIAQILSGQKFNCIEDIYWLRPLNVSSDTQLELNWIDKDTHNFALSNNGIEYMKGRFSLNSLPLNEPIPPLDIAEIKKRCTTKINSSTLYQQFADYGLSYGSSFQVICEANLGENEALCYLENQLLNKIHKPFNLEPSLLDGLFQSVVASYIFNNPYAHQQVPYHLEQAIFLKPLTTNCIAHVRLLKANTYYLTLYSMDGQVLINFCGFTKRPLTNDTNVKCINYYSTEWIADPLKMHRQRANCVLLFNWSDQNLKHISPRLQNIKLIHVIAGDTFSKTPNNQYQVAPQEKESWKELFTDLANNGFTIDNLVFSSFQFSNNEAVISEHAINKNVLSLLALSQAAIQTSTGNNLRLLYVYDQACSVQSCVHSMTGGFFRTLIYENPNLQFLTLGLDEKARADTPQIIAQEIAYHSHPPLNEIVYQQRIRKTRIVKTFHNFEKKITPTLAEKGVYLISGGAGKIASVFALYLAKACMAKIILIGRSPANQQTQKILSAIKQAGGTGLYVKADVSKQSDVSHVFTKLEQENLQLSGIIHAAGFIEDAFILKKQADSFSRVLQPKVTGLINLDKASLSHPLKFFLLTSSVAALMPNQGQCDYATGNSFMDAFAYYRNQLYTNGSRPGKCIAINWPLWKNGGITVSNEEEQYLRDTFGMYPINNDQAESIFSKLIALSNPPNQCIIIDGNQKIIEQCLKVTNSHNNLKMQNNLEAVVWNLISIKHCDQNSEASFSDLGLDSLALVRLASSLNQAFNLNLKPSIFFEFQTVPSLTNHLTNLGANISTTLNRHALIDQSIDKLHYQKMLYNDEFFMRDHIVEGQYNVPGACFVEMGLQAFIKTQTEARAYLLTNNYWIRKLSSSGTPIDMRIRLKPKTNIISDKHNDSDPTRNTYEYEIYQDEKDSVNAIGEVSFASTENIEKLNKYHIQIEQIKSQTTNKLNAEQLYPQIIAEGLHIGSTFMPIVEISFSHNEALSRLRLPESISETETDYILHPTMLTGVLQTALLNNKPNGVDGTQFIPIAIDEILVTQALPKECYIHTHPHTQNRKNQEIRKFDAVVTTLSGTAIAYFNGVSLRCISNSYKQANIEKKPSKIPKFESSGNKLNLHSNKETLSIKQVEILLITLCSKHIGLKQNEIDPSAPFEDFGIDSVMVVDLNRALENTFGKLSKTLFFEYRNFSELSEYFIRDHQTKIYQQLDLSNNTEALTEISEAQTKQNTKQENNHHNSKLFSLNKNSLNSDTSSKSEINGDIAIIGVAGRYPQAQDLKAFWQLLLDGSDCIQKVPKQRISDALLSNRLGSFIDHVDCFDALFFKISPRQAELLDPQERLFLEVVWETLENAGYNQSRLDTITKKIGVFVGALWQPYMELGAEQSLLGNELGPSGLLYNIPNRISYYFDWTGPSLAIDTACSSSLTALHYACMSLNHGECDHAIAGGVNLTLSSGKYRFLDDNGFLSSDGRCRSFGEGGDGYVPGEGVGSVFLKRLHDAEHQGDRILAIIRSTTINHGGKTHGFTVPNPTQQAELVKDALKKAHVHPREVSYVEAHGTGTSLGDPIEITGLKKAFEEKTSDYQFCPIGSLKSNIGHLEAAAGIAGLTKILLQLEHKTLVPSIHANKINPNIDFETSPFYVQTEVSPWESHNTIDNDSSPRIALLSSFGAGGSNAHTVIQEYILENHHELTNSDTVLDQIFPLSAQDPETLNHVIKRLATYLEELSENQQPKLGDIAYTLQCGRNIFKYRAVFITDNYHDLIQQLNKFDTSLQSVSLSDSDVFNDETWQQTCHAWVDQAKASPLAHAWLTGMPIHWQKLHKKSYRKITNLPSYPFKRQRYWLPNFTNTKQSLEIFPEVSNALKQKENSIHPLLHKNTSTLEKCQFESNFEYGIFFVNGHQISNKPVLPGAAQMGMILAAAEIALPNGAFFLADVVFSAPIGVNNSDQVKVKLELTPHTDGAAFTIRDYNYKLCSSGRIIKHKYTEDTYIDLTSLQSEPAEKLSAEYIYDQLQSVGLDLGHGMRTLKQLKVLTASTGVLASIELSPAGELTKGLNPGLFDAIFQLTGWLSFKVYNQLLIPFELKHVEVYADLPSHCYAYVTSCDDFNVNQSIRRYNACIVDHSGKIIIRVTNVAVRSINLFEKSSNSSDSLLESQTKHSRHSSLLISAPRWIEKPLKNNALSQLVNTLVCCLDLRFDSNIENSNKIEWLPLTTPEDKSLTESTVFIANQLRKILQIKLSSSEPQKLIFVIPIQHEILASVTAGMIRSIAIEYPLIQVKHIRYSSTTTNLHNKLITEMSDVSSIEVLLDGPTRKVRTWEQLNILRAETYFPNKDETKENISETSINSWLLSTGAYWITGGLGKLGKSLLQHIAMLAPQAKIFLSGRSTLTAEQQSYLDELVTKGLTLKYLPCNVANKHDVAQTLSQIHKQVSQLNGIFHLAGIYRDSLFKSKTKTDFEQVFSAKVLGTFNLDLATQNEALDFFLCFSSIAGAAGNIGQSDYAAANGFQDAYMTYRQTLVSQEKRKGHSISIAWPLWLEGSMQVTDLARIEKQMGIRPMPSELGLSAIAKILQTKSPRILVTYGNKENIQRKLSQDFVTLPLSPKSTTHEPSYLSDQLSIDLKTIFANLIKLPSNSVSMNVSLRDYGAESVALTEFSNAINHQFEINITPTLFFDHLNLAAVCNHLLETYSDEMSKHFRSENQNMNNQTHYPISESQLSSFNLDKPINNHLNKQEQPREQQPPKQCSNPIAHEQANKVSKNTPLAIAIVGISGQFPGSQNLDAFWKNLVAGHDHIIEIPTSRWDWEQYSNSEADEATRWGGFIDGIENFDAQFFNISPREAALMDPQHRKLLENVWACLENSGTKPSEIAGSRTAVFVAVANHDYAERLSLNGTEIQGHTSTGNTFSVLANRISFMFDLQGPSEPVDTACSSSLVALDRAIQSIQSGRSEAALVGAVNALLTPTFFTSFSRAGMLAPDGRCKTFDKSANGYVRSEGFAAIYLKPLAKAEANGDHIYAVIRGSSVNHNGKVHSLTAPNASAQTRLLLEAYEMADINPRAIGYIEAHGTGTALGDPVEIEALKNAFSLLYNKNEQTPNKETPCGLGSVKSNIGHLESAAGMAGLLKVILALQYKMLPPTLHLRQQNPYIDLEGSPFYFVTDTCEWKAYNSLPRCAGISSFGFGGVNAHVVIEEYVPNEILPDQENIKPQCFVLSAKTKNQLAQRIRQLAEDLPTIENKDIQRLAFTLQLGREHMPYRAAFVTDKISILEKQLTEFEFLELTEDQTKKESNHDGYYCNSDQYQTKLLSEDEIELLTERWITNGQIHRLATAWVKGEEINWSKLYTQNPRRLPLPTYPFASQHFPLPDLKINTSQSKYKNKELIGTKATLHSEINHIDKGDSLADIISQHIADVTETPIAHLDLNKKITDFGLDSLLIAELSNRLEPILGFRDPSIFYTGHTIQKTAQKITARFPNFSKSIDTDVTSVTSIEIKPDKPKHANLRDEDVAIIGLSGRYPQANDILQFAKILADGRDCIEPVPETYLYSYDRPRWGSFISDTMSFDFGHFNMSYRDALVAHPEERLLLQEAWKCFESAGYNPLQWLDSSGANIGVYIGASFHEYPELISEINQHNKNTLPYSSQIFTYANRLSYFFNLIGPSIALDSACSSSLYAIYDAYNAIRFGLCDMALAGGVNLSLHRSKYDFLDDMNFLAEDGRCRAFAEGGTGYVPGEGVGITLLKSLKQALHDGDNVLAVIKGAATGNDGRTQGFTVPNPDRQCDTIRKALAVSQVSPQSISFIECHGTGTSLGDPIELSALSEAFGQDISISCPISSVKSNIGHLEAAAGIAQLSKVVLQLQSQTYFPNVMHHKNFNPNINFDQIPFQVQTKLAPWPVSGSQIKRRAGISSFGAGGTNVHLILEEAPEAPESILESGLKYLIPFCADSSDQLYDIVKNTYLFLSSSTYLNSSHNIRNIAATLQQGRSAKIQRIVFICKNSIQDLLALMQEYLQAQQNKTEINNLTIISGKAIEPGQNEIMGRGASDIELQTVAKNWVIGAVKNFQIDPEAKRVYLPSYSFRQDLVSPISHEGNCIQENASDSFKSKSIVNTLDLVRTTLKKVMGALPKVYTDDQLFSDLGVDSIMATRIHTELIKTYPEFDLFSLFEFNTSSLLCKHLDSLAIKDHAQAIPATISTNSDTTQTFEEVGDIGKIEFGHDQISVKTYIDAYHQWDEVKQKIRIDRVFVKQCNIEFLCCGQGPTIVLLPPFNSTGIIWIRQLQVLSNQFQVIVPHYPGLSNSDWHEGLDDFQVLAEYMAAFIDVLVKNKLVLTKKVHWVGWSLGGFLAQTINKHYPEYMDRLVLISTTTISWSSKEYTISGEEFSIKCAEEFQENFDKLPPPLRNMPEMKALKEDGHIERFVLGTTNRRIIDSYFRMIARFRNVEAASNVQAKTLLISGADDVLMPAKFARILSEKIPNSKYHEIPNGLHFLSLFHYKTVNKLLHEWFACKPKSSKNIKVIKSNLI